MWTVSMGRREASFVCRKLPRPEVLSGYFTGFVGPGNDSAVVAIAELSGALDSLSPLGGLRHQKRHRESVLQPERSRCVICREVIEFLSEYLSGELTAAERAEFEAHLSECLECVAYLDTYQKTIQFGKAVYSYAHSEDRVSDEVPEELVRAVLAARTKRT
jgi:hypothetical protein